MFSLTREEMDAAVARRVWKAVGTLLPQLNIRLHAIAGAGCEAGAQRSYLRGQYDLLTADLWSALDLPEPPEFAKIRAETAEGRNTTMGEPEQAETVETEETAEAAAETEESAEAEQDTAD